MHAMHTYANTHEHTEGHHCMHPRMLHYDTAYTLTAPYVDTSYHPPPTHVLCEALPAHATKGHCDCSVNTPPMARRAQHVGVHRTTSS